MQVQSTFFIVVERLDKGTLAEVLAHQGAQARCAEIPRPQPCGMHRIPAPPLPLVLRHVTLRRHGLLALQVGLYGRPSLR